MPSKPTPAGYHAVTPYLVVRDAAALIVFLEKTFEATVAERIERPDGTVRHAEVLIGDSRVMLGEPDEAAEPMPATLYVYVADCDAVYRRALAAGATSLLEPADQVYGDRSAGLSDPSGCRWWIATHVEDVSTEELMKRAAAEAS